MIEIHAKSVTNGLIIMLGKVEMCRFLRCNGSIVRHYTSGIINVEEPIIDIDIALVHPQPELLDAVRGARTEETTTMKALVKVL
ncbi:hypothetical protein MTR_7g017780 [Medicago truncatula]|uniref:Uncharacterized protein n=1 Tax=Medicago truncatula TaxID=3880 RepID=A0A072U7G2_MEDTR|nr:hypothetical protein MTR_7g017780 [Medicago truncatula]